MIPPKPDNESERLAALHALNILDTLPEEAFDDLTRLAAHICGVPMAAVSLIDDERQWFKSIIGVAVGETPRDIAFCAHTILQPDLLVVPDAAADPRFADNPLVTGDVGIRFYAGAPLVTDDGHALGSLCVIDRVPRRLSPEQTAALGALARQAAALLALRRSMAERERADAERAQALQEREEYHALFEAALGAMDEALMVQDRLGNVLVSNRRADEMLGASEGRLEGQGTTQADWRYLRSDGSDFPRADRPSRLALQTGQAVRDVVLGIEKPGKSILWLSVNAVPLFHAGKDAAYAAAITLTDVTERRRSEDALRRSEALLAEAQRTAGIGSWEYNLETGTITWSAEIFRLLGFDPADGEPDYETMLTHYHPDDVPMHRQCVTRAVETGQSYEFDIRVLCDGGDGFRWAHAIGHTERDMAGKVTRLSGTVMDIDARKRAEQSLQDHAVIMEFQKNELAEANAHLEESNARLEALATEDGLTGLKNYRAFQERLEVEMSRAARYGTPLSLVLLDVDHFKRYNDRWGHPAGDGVLKTVARLLQQNARGTDLAARYGGEEFVLILPQTSQSGAFIIAERVRRAIERAAWDKETVTASFGVATLSLGMDGGAVLVARADRALYQAKAEGRNRVTAGHSRVGDLSASLPGD
ncbi:MAG: diguanylate cyclase [Armatimonadota bacterium]|nr:diguanylate cyclase [Armatimonadota bacterium]